VWREVNRRLGALVDYMGQNCDLEIKLPRELTTEILDHIDMLKTYEDELTEV